MYLGINMEIENELVYISRDLTEDLTIKKNEVFSFT